MAWILVDCEANAISPFSGVMTEFGAVEYRTRRTFHGVLWDGRPDPLNPARSQLVAESLARRPRAVESYGVKQWEREHDVQSSLRLAVDQLLLRQDAGA